MKIKNLFKTAAVLLAVLLAVSALAVFASAAGEGTITVADASGKAGEEVTVAIALQNNPGIISLTFDVTFDEALTVTNIETVNEIGWENLYTQVTPETLNKNPKTYSYAADTAPASLTEDGGLAIVTFQIPADAEVGTTYEVTATTEGYEGDIYNFDMEQQTVVGSTGTITVIDCRHENLEEVPAVPATCVAEGTEAYYKCAECGKLFADAEATTEIEAPATTEIDPTNHANLTACTEAKEPTCEEAGAKALYVCECGKYIVDGEEIEVPEDAESLEDVLAAIADILTIPATGHEYVKVDAKEATATEAGNKEYYTCANCDKIFVKNDAGEYVETTLEDVTIPATGEEPKDDPKDEDPGKDSPQTGDSMTIVFASVAMVLAAAAVATAVVIKKRENA